MVSLKMKLLLTIFLLINITYCVKWSTYYYDNDTCFEAVQNVCAKSLCDETFYVIDCSYSDKSVVSIDPVHKVESYRTGCSYRYYSDSKCLNKIKEIYPRYTQLKKQRVEKCSDFTTDKCDFYAVDDKSGSADLFVIIFSVSLLAIIFILYKLHEMGYLIILIQTILIFIGLSMGLISLNVQSYLPAGPISPITTTVITSILISISFFFSMLIYTLEKKGIITFPDCREEHESFFRVRRGRRWLFL